MGYKRYPWLPLVSPKAIRQERNQEIKELIVALKAVRRFLKLDADYIEHEETKRLVYEAVKELEAIGERIESYFARDGADFINADGWSKGVQAINLAAAWLKIHVYDRLCPECRGLTCAECRGRGWVSLKSLADLRQKLKAEDDDGA